MRAALYGPQGLFYKGRGQNENFVLSPFLTHTLHEESDTPEDLEWREREMNFRSTLSARRAATRRRKHQRNNYNFYPRSP